MDRSLVVWSGPIMESDSGSAYKAASFTSCISHRFRIPIALFHPIHPCPWVRGTGHMERVSAGHKDVFFFYRLAETPKEEEGGKKDSF